VYYYIMLLFCYQLLRYWWCSCYCNHWNVSM